MSDMALIQVWTALEANVSFWVDRKRRRADCCEFSWCMAVLGLSPGQRGFDLGVTPVLQLPIGPEIQSRCKSSQRCSNKFLTCRKNVKRPRKTQVPLGLTIANVVFWVAAEDFLENFKLPYPLSDASRDYGNVANTVFLKDTGAPRRASHTNLNRGCRLFDQ